METALDNSNGATLDNLNQDVYQKSNLLTDVNLDMDIKNTNITSPALDPLNNIQSYTIDNQKTSEIIDQNRISNDDFIFDENNQQDNNITPIETNGKKIEYIAAENYFGPESNVDDDTTGSPVLAEMKSKNENDDIEHNIDVIKPHVASHGIHFENVEYLKTVDEAEESDGKNIDVDPPVSIGLTLADVHMLLTAPRSSDFIANMKKQEKLAKLQNPFADQCVTENVNVPESGEESEDEWNYINIKEDNKENDPNIILQERQQSPNICPDLLNDNQSQDDEIAKIEELSLSEADMASQLNPDAKEFVPTSPSPTNTTPLNSLEVNGLNAAMASLNIHFGDDLVSQSPRKGCEKTLVNVTVPEENDFLNDISKRPSELDANAEVRPGSSSSQCSYQEMNLKEAMHGDEKQEYAPDAVTTPDVVGYEANGDHEEFIENLNKSMRNQDVMNTSFYNDGTSDSNNPFKVDLNAVHRLPVSDEENEDDIVEGSGTTYSYEDTEFGMSDLMQMSNVETPFGARPAAGDVVVPQSGSNCATQPELISHEIESISDAVQEMISEKMAVLIECELTESDTQENRLFLTPVVKAMTLPVVENVSLSSDESSTSDMENVEIISSTLIAEPALAPEQLSSMELVNESTTEDISLDVRVATEDISQDVSVATQDVSQDMSIATENISQDVSVATENISQEVPFAAENISQDVPIATEDISQDVRVATEDISQDVLVATEDISQDVRVATEDISQDVRVATEDITQNVPVATEDITQNVPVATEEISQDLPVATEDISKDVPVITEPIAEIDAEPAFTAVASVASVASVVAVAAVAVVAAKSQSTMPQEPKCKTAPGTKKTLSAGSPTKPKAKPSSQSDVTAKPAPIPRPRTVVSQPQVKSNDKKSSPTVAAKKQVNGEVKSSTAAAGTKRPISSTTTFKSTIAARSTAATTTATTTTKATTARLITKTTTTTTDAAKRAPISRTSTTTSSTVRVRPSPEKSTSIISKSSPPKLNTSVTDKLSKDTANKLQSATRAPASPRSTSATSPRVGAPTAKKVDAAKIPSAPAPIKRPTTAPNSVQEKRLPATTASSKLLPSQKRSSINRPTSVEPAKKLITAIKKDTKPQANAKKESKSKSNGTVLNGTDSRVTNEHSIEINSSTVVENMNVLQEPVLI